MFLGGQQVKNCFPPRTKQKLCNRQLKNCAFPTCQAPSTQLLIDKKDSENTQKATKNAAATLLAFFNEILRNESSLRDDKYLEELSSEELNELLTAFYPNARKKPAKITKKIRLYWFEIWS